MLIVKPKDVEKDGKYEYHAPQYRMLEKIRAQLQQAGHSPGPWEVTSRGYRMIAGLRCLKCRRCYFGERQAAGKEAFVPLPASKIHAEECRFAKYVTVEEAAERLEVKKTHLTRWRNDGRLKGTVDEVREFRTGSGDRFATTAFLAQELDRLKPRIQRAVNKKGHTVIRLPWPETDGGG